MISILSVDGQVILATTALVPSVMSVMNLATLPRTAPTGFLYQEYHGTTEDLIQGIDSSSDSSSDSDGDSDPLNYWGPLPVVMKMSGEGTPQTTTY